jgi:hypothetical protein
MTPHINLNLSGPEFSGSPDTRVWTHSESGFRPLLRRLNYHHQWHSLMVGIHQRYRLASQRPHTVYESFLRGDHGYVPMIIAVRSPIGRAQVRGVLYRCRMAEGVSEERRLAALYDLGASAITQWLAQVTEDPGYIIRWEKPL